MRNFTLRLIIICTLFFSLNESVSSQILYGLKKSINNSTTIPFDIVKIDPFTGVTTIEMSTNSLANVAAGATTYDQQNKRYICWGLSNTGTNEQLHIIDLDDVTSSTVPFASVQPIEMEYDLQTQKTYGLWWDGSAEHFGEIDLTTGVTVSIAILSNIEAIAAGNSTFDSNTGTYIFIGFDGTNHKLYSINASNGTIISSPIIWQNGRYSALEYNVNNNKLYGLYYDLDYNDFSADYSNYYTNLQLVEIDLTTGISTVVNTQSSVISGYEAGYFLGGLCFDQQSETYIVHAVNENGSFFKLVDVLTGNLVASTPLVRNDYFYEIQVDNYSFANTFYNLESTETTKADLLDATVYPNPTTDYLTIETTKNLEELSIYNSDGQIVKEEIIVDNNQILINDLPKGHYYIIAKTENGYIREQFVKQ